MGACLSDPCRNRGGDQVEVVTEIQAGGAAKQKAAISPVGVDDVAETKSFARGSANFSIKSDHVTYAEPPEFEEDEDIDGKASVIKRGSLVLHTDTGMQDSYTMKDQNIGEGTYGTVYPAKHRKTGATYAVKSCASSEMKINHEIDILKILDHPNIVRLFHTFQDDKGTHLLFELCTGGDIHHRLDRQQNRRLTETHAAIVIQQVLRAVFYCHSVGVIHRDIKPNNCLFFTKAPIEKNVLKVIDFGFADFVKMGDTIEGKLGTWDYVAPEVLSGKPYTHAVDMWSIGCVLYLCLCGARPWPGKSEKERFQYASSGKKPALARSGLSQEAQSLIVSLLNVDVSKRPTARQALEHKWIASKAPKHSVITFPENFVESVADIKSYNKLRRAALHVIAGQVSEEQVATMRETFLALDTNKDGRLQMEELRRGMADAGIGDVPEDISNVFNAIDSNADGAIDYTEFLAAAVASQRTIGHGLCLRAFTTFDLDRNGRISINELEGILNEPGGDQMRHSATSVEVQRAMDETDADGDGEITFTEFMKMMRQPTNRPEPLSGAPIPDTSEREPSK